VRKRADALAHGGGGVAFSGVWPLLGWNAPGKPPLSPAARAYAEARNQDDAYLWRLARRTARERLAARADGAAARARFDALQLAYAAGVARDGAGFYSFCDWRVKDYERSHGAGDGANGQCLACAAAQATRPCTAQCWNQPLVDGRPGISSNSSVSLKSNSFTMILEPLIQSFPSSRRLTKKIIGDIRSESTRVEGILKSLFPS